MTKETKDGFQTDVYRKGTEPKAAEFGVGASDLKERGKASDQSIFLRAVMGRNVNRSAARSVMALAVGSGAAARSSSYLPDCTHHVSQGAS